MRSFIQEGGEKMKKKSLSPEIEKVLLQLKNCKNFIPNPQLLEAKSLCAKQNTKGS